MVQRQKPYRALFLIGTFLFFLYNTGCFKEEYSYEGGPLRDTTTITDTTSIVDTTRQTDSTIVVDTAFAFPDCNFCKYATSLTQDQWNFRYDTNFLCGTVTNAVMTPDKNAFTFFGPSSCTEGTGLIITAFFETTFDGDRAGVVSNQVTMQYYNNNNGGKDIFVSGPGTKFSITINQFLINDRTAIGRFNGTVLTSTGEIVPINSGNFKIQFH
jgi:hypothetical protein